MISKGEDEAAFPAASSPGVQLCFTPSLALAAKTISTLSNG
jgi:hypothetical protein